MNYYIEHFEGDREKAIRLLDKVNRVKSSWGEEFTDFLNPDEQLLVKNICSSEGLYCRFFGGKGNFERAVGVISPYEYFGDFPVDFIKITGNFKFEKLSHRDYLGSILSLGIKREKIGDINTYEDGAEIAVHRDISDYICFNIDKIKHTGVKLQKIPFDDLRERALKLKEMVVNAASLRLDSIVAGVTGMSRAEASGTIKGGGVKVNYALVCEPSKNIKEGDMISIRGYGRYKFESLLGKTKRDRITLQINKYI
ncbi:RNA-binding protein [Fonticella tunisiensis]|uniref:RNA-binding protein YlmH n=1 Tax=Fonticella tunisiensis TaxID=1096341 RepID=A0A4R7KSF2_9CLOT|nr:YlmH/Sll1252 family protein [Fonticella tunisiensis]TDT61836.1 RNA-binding protein YlmH [Fonticella tunisiensis]